MDLVLVLDLIAVQDLVPFSGRGPGEVLLGALKHQRAGEGELHQRMCLQGCNMQQSQQEPPQTDVADVQGHQPFISTFCGELHGPALKVCSWEEFNHRRTVCEWRPASRFNSCTDVTF